jgi:DNA processing protein
MSATPASSTEELAGATLACLPSMTPRRLRALLELFGDCRAALAAVRGRRALAALVGSGVVHEQDRDRLARDWAGADPCTIAVALASRGTRIYLLGSSGYPIADAVPDRPAVLLAEGARPEVLERPRVAIVGTRSASPHGLRDARDLGAHVARAGITVVSGLAIGVDGAAHEGALDAGGGVVGVVATGLDVVYPRRHSVLYERVRSEGLLVSESAFGVRPARDRFPVRNRIIAGLADVVVVVEATLTGGARITANYALEYDRPVLAVPGSRRNPAAAGCNALLADGAHPLLEPDDVLVALGMCAGGRRGWGAPPARPTPSGEPAAVLKALAGEAATADQLASRTSLPPGRVALALRSLERDRWVEFSRGLVWPR